MSIIGEFFGGEEALPEEEVQEEVQEESEDAIDDQVDEQEGEVGDDEVEEDNLDVEPDDDSDNDLIPISYKDKDGKDVEEEVSYNELTSLYSQYKNGDLDVGEYQKAIRSAAPLIRSYRDSTLLQNIYQYRLQGYSDEQILQHYIQNVGKQGEQAKAEPEFATIEEQVAYKVEQELKKHLEPIKQQVNSTQQQKVAEEVSYNNYNVLKTALKKRYDVDIDSLGDVERQAITQSILDMLPNADTATLKLTQPQAYMAMRDAMEKINIQKERSSKAKKITNAFKNNKAPKIMSGVPNRGVRESSKPMNEPRRGMTKDEIKTANSKLWENLF